SVLRESMRAVVPTFENVKPFATRAGVERADESFEGEWSVRGWKGVRPHRHAKARQRAGKVSTRLERIENGAPPFSGQRVLEQLERAGVAHLRACAARTHTNVNCAKNRKPASNTPTT